MVVVFDAEALLAFAFDEPGADEVEHWLDLVYDGERDGYVSTINLAEFRYIASRKTSAKKADAHIDRLQDMAVTEYPIDNLWRDVSELKATYSLAIGDAYALAAAKHLDSHTEQKVTLLVGADDDYDIFEDTNEFAHLIKQFRDKPN